MKRTSLLERDYQLKFWLRFCGLTIGGFTAFALLLYLTTGRDLGQSYGEAIYTIYTLKINISSLILASAYSIAIMVFTAVFITLVSVFFSHRMAGPIFRLTQDFKPFVSGDMRGETRFRKLDQYALLAGEKNNMTERLRTLIAGTKGDMTSVRETCARLGKMVTTGEGEEEIRECLKELTLLVEEMKAKTSEIKTSR